MAPKIAVMAGTLIDTRMGMDVLEQQGLQGVYLPLSHNPQEQTMFQLSSQEEKHRRVLQLLQAAKSQGCEKAFIYCNSLSGAVDFSLLAQESGLYIVTPLQVYALLAKRYRSLGVIAANATGGAAGIEKTLLSANPDLQLISMGILPLVEAIERQVPPQALIERFQLAALCQWMKGNGAEALLLGCTHFPYFKDELAPLSPLPLLDPAEEMIALLQN